MKLFPISVSVDVETLFLRNWTALAQRTFQELEGGGMRLEPFGYSETTFVSQRLGVGHNNGSDPHHRRKSVSEHPPTP